LEHEDDRTETSDLADRELSRVKRMAQEWEQAADRVGVRPDLSRILDGVAQWHARNARSVRDETARRAGQ
jgi:hypothetical protein